MGLAKWESYQIVHQMSLHLVKAINPPTEASLPINQSIVHPVSRSKLIVPMTVLKEGFDDCTTVVATGNSDESLLQQPPFSLIMDAEGHRGLPSKHPEKNEMLSLSTTSVAAKS